MAPSGDDKVHKDKKKLREPLETQRTRVICGPEKNLHVRDTGDEVLASPRRHPHAHLPMIEVHARMRSRQSRVALGARTPAWAGQRSRRDEMPVLLRVFPLPAAWHRDLCHGVPGRGV